MKFAILLLAVSIIQSARAACWLDREGIKWCDVPRIVWQLGGEKDSMKYAEHCAFDFDGRHSLKTTPVPAEYSNLSAGLLCGTYCLKEERCTHFSVSNDATCVMKHNARDKNREPNRKIGRACGFISTRTDLTKTG